MPMIMNLLPALVVLGVLIFIHELGHFLACKLYGVRVDKFSIGFGPEIFHFQGKETRYAISLIPLGGFVKPSGESHQEVGAEGLKPYDFLAKGPGVRFVIAAAGIIMNFVLAYVLFAAVFILGRPILSAKIGGLVEGYPATASQLKSGDKVLEVNGAKVASWRELTGAIQTAGEKEIAFHIEREGSDQTVLVLPKVEEVNDAFGKKHRISRIGILPSDEYYVEKYAPVQAFREAGVTLGNFTALTFKSIGYLATGRLSMKAVSGPIGIFAIASKTAKLGIVHLLQLTALLSASLAIFNVLPFPPLDGGLLLFTLIEWVGRRQVSFRVQDWVTKAGFALLMLLMVFVMYNDLANLAVFEKIKNLIHR